MILHKMGHFDPARLITLTFAVPGAVWQDQTVS